MIVQKINTHIMFIGKMNQKKLRTAGTEMVNIKNEKKHNYTCFRH